jgi:hypothetical protein
MKRGEEVNIDTNAGVPKRAISMLFGGLLTGLVACSGSTPGSWSSAAPGVPPPPEPLTTTSRGGYFYGSVDSGSVGCCYAEAIITEEGDARIYIQAAARNSTETFEPIQFKGSLELHDDGRANGAGLLVGERCRGPDDGQFCGGGVQAEVDLDSLGNKRLHGVLVVHDAMGQGQAPWIVSMTWPTDTYDLSNGGLASEQGIYREALADFAHDDDVVHSIDAEGRWFFQSAHTGCTGNGLLTPHANGELNVYDVQLSIDACDADYAYLNRTMTGLASRTTGDLDWWGDWLVFFVSSPADQGQPVALTMWGERY